jgi:hypothetical protein
MYKTQSNLCLSSERTYCKLVNVQSVLFWVLVINTLIFSSCKESVRLDRNKLDSSYFEGEYKTNYLGIIERITLKSNGFYDYSNNDTLILDVGKWFFLTINIV